MFFLAQVEAFNQEVMVTNTNTCLHMALVLAAPMLIAAIAAQVVIAMFQAATQVQEQTLSFVPKIVCTFWAVLMYGPWIASEVVSFTVQLWSIIATCGPYHH